MAVSTQNISIYERLRGVVDEHRETTLQKTKNIKQHQTNVTADFVANKMKNAGENLRGREYTLKDYHKEMLSIKGIQFKEISDVKAAISGNNKNKVLELGKKEAEKDTYWTSKWRADKVEMEFEKEVANELKKAPKEGFVLLKPLSPNNTVSYEKELSDWYDPVLRKSYNELDWVKNADGFIPELKTTIEVKSTSNTKRPSQQNKGLNTADLRNYDGVVGYAKIVTNETKSYPDLGYTEQQKDALCKQLVNILDFYNIQPSAIKKENYNHFRKLIESKDIVYSFTVEQTFVTMYKIETIAKVIRAKLQQLGLEAGQPLGKSFVAEVKRDTKWIEAVKSYLNNICRDDDFVGIIGMEQLIRDFNSGALSRKIDTISNRADINSAPELLEAVLDTYFDEEWKRIFKGVAKEVGKVFYSPTVMMNTEYENKYAEKDLRNLPLGGSTRLT